MRSGKLRHRIIIEEPTSGSANKYNESGTTWPTLTTVWGEVREMSGKEAFEQAQVQPQITHKVKTRYDSQFNTALRINFGGRYLYPTSIIDDPKKIYQIWMCKEQK
jgi:SPP1 family predicted phage head-tail adaptor